MIKRHETPDRGNIFRATERSKMADREPSNNFYLAINLLRQATEILSSSELSENENNSSPTPARPSSSSVQSQNPISPSPTPDRDAAVKADFSNPFSPYTATVMLHVVHHFLVHRNPHGHQSGEVGQVLTPKPKRHRHTIFFF